MRWAAQHGADEFDKRLAVRLAEVQRESDKKQARAARSARHDGMRRRRPTAHAAGNGAGDRNRRN
jgi:hypothetical protein